jgi:hypothetical protein
MTGIPGAAPRRLPGGRLEVPARAEGPNGEIGDGIVVVGPGDELYDMWEAWITRRERDAAGPDDHHQR